MAGSKEIRNKIKSVQSTRKITKAMEMVAASKMKKAQDRMRASRPYVELALQIAMHVAKANTEYKHPFLARRETVKRVGAIVVTTDKGLCGGLNTNVLRLVLGAHKEWRAKGLEVDYCAIGAKGLASSAVSAPTSSRRWCSSGDRPHLDKLVGPVKVLLDKYIDGDDRRGARVLHHVHQHDEAGSPARPDAADSAAVPHAGPARCARWRPRPASWDYIYEPDAKELLDGVLRRYVEALVFQMVNENMASEQSARMVAMRAASDNAGTIIDELQLIYNKTRQAAITKELAEIVGGAAAV